MLVLGSWNHPGRDQGLATVFGQVSCFSSHSDMGMEERDTMGVCVRGWKEGIFVPSSFRCG